MWAYEIAKKSKNDALISRCIFVITENYQYINYAVLGKNERRVNNYVDAIKMSDREKEIKEHLKTITLGIIEKNLLQKERLWIRNLLKIMQALGMDQELQEAREIFINKIFSLFVIEKKDLNELIRLCKLLSDIKYFEELIPENVKDYIIQNNVFLAKK